MFDRLDCVCLHTDDLDASLAFLTSMGMSQSWRLDRALDDGRAWSLIGLDFRDRTSSQLVLSTHPDRRDVEVEVRVADVREACEALSRQTGVEIVAEPFAIERGWVAVIAAPGGNMFVLIDGPAAGTSSDKG
jgi:catechol 2,3-dioxygenase-like lactoylglutathione lyase family enzyme